MNKDKHCLIIRLTILLFFSLFVLDGSEFQQPLVAFFPSAIEIRISPPTWWISHWQILHQAGAVLLCSDSRIVAIVKQPVLEIDIPIPILHQLGKVLWCLGLLTFVFLQRCVGVSLTV